MAERSHKKNDYLALIIFITVFIVGVVMAILGVRSIHKEGDFLTFNGASEWFEDFDEYRKKVFDFLELKQKPRPKQGGTSRGHVSKGYRLYKKKEYQQARVQFDRAIESDPKNPDAYFWRGYMLVKMGQKEEAVPDFLRSLELRPDYRAAHDNLGWIYTQKQDYDKGIFHLTRSIRLDDRNGWAYYQRGRCYSKKGVRDRALADIKRACELGYQDGCALFDRMSLKQ